MLYRFGGGPVLLVPGAGTAMQVGYPARFCLLQVAGEHLGKQVVVAVPSPLVIERDHKEIRFLERFQGCLSMFLTGHRLTEWSTEALQNRGGEQEFLHRRRLPQEYFLGEVVQHEAMAASEGREKRGDIGAASHGERGKLESRDPAF